MYIIILLSHTFPQISHTYIYIKQQQKQMPPLFSSVEILTQADLPNLTQHYM